MVVLSNRSKDNLRIAYHSAILVQTYVGSLTVTQADFVRHYGVSHHSFTNAPANVQQLRDKVCYRIICIGESLNHILKRDRIPGPTRTYGTTGEVAALDACFPTGSTQSIYLYARARHDAAHQLDLLDYQMIWNTAVSDIPVLASMISSVFAANGDTL